MADMMSEKMCPSGEGDGKAWDRILRGLLCTGDVIMLCTGWESV